MANILTAALAIAIIIINTVYIYDVIFYDYEAARQFEVQNNGIIFAVLGLIFFFIGLTISKILVQKFEAFYSSYKCALYGATFALSIPILFRGLFDIIRANVSKGWETYIQDSETYDISSIVVDIVVYFIGLIIPLVVQLASLIFGKIRSNV